MTSTERATPLSALPAGKQGVVHSLHGGHDFCSRLANLGFTAGAFITVVQNYGSGPMLVSLRGNEGCSGPHRGSQGARLRR